MKMDLAEWNSGELFRGWENPAGPSQFAANHRSQDRWNWRRAAPGGGNRGRAPGEGSLAAEAPRDEATKLRAVMAQPDEPSVEAEKIPPTGAIGGD